MVSKNDAAAPAPLKPELLAPAKDFETLKYALAYGADAIYIGGLEFGMRKPASNFNLAQIEEATAFAHNMGRKIYVAANIFLKDDDFKAFEIYLKALAKIGVDAVILADPGAVLLASELGLALKIHLSTQANVTNLLAAKFYSIQGAKRITLARELSLDEIEKITKESEAEIEVFVHGAMCIAYSGRCLISAYLAGREANRGECAQSCRWKYHLVEEERPGEFLPVMEDERGVYLFNSKDLCLASKIGDLIEIGVDSFKIEGRMKSLHYVATVTRVYRMLIDEYLGVGSSEKRSFDWALELKKVSHRGYTLGFLEREEKAGQSESRERPETSSYLQSHKFLGVVKESNPNFSRVLVKNGFRPGDQIEVLTPGPIFDVAIGQIRDVSTGQILETANPNQVVDIELGRELPAYSLLRVSLGSLT